MSFRSGGANKASERKKGFKKAIDADEARRKREGTKTRTRTTRDAGMGMGTGTAWGGCARRVGWARDDGGA